MIVQLSEAIIIRSERRFWQIKPRWRAWIWDHDAWKILTDPLQADDMLQTLIQNNHPQRDIGLFVQALNSPGQYPFSKATPRTEAAKHLKLQPREAGDKPALPKGLFVEAG